MMEEVKDKKPHCPQCGKRRKVYLFKEVCPTQDIMTDRSCLATDICSSLIKEQINYYIACGNCNSKWKIENYGIFNWK